MYCIFGHLNSILIIIRQKNGLTANLLSKIDFLNVCTAHAAFKNLDMMHANTDKLETIYIHVFWFHFWHCVLLEIQTERRLIHIDALTYTVHTLLCIQCWRGLAFKLLYIQIKNNNMESYVNFDCAKTFYKVI